MTLSTLEPRKNMELLLRAFSEVQDSVDYDLVLVGRKGWKVDELIQKYDSNHRIHITGFIKDEHLNTIYRNAECFVFPSLYEGFGLPPVEALSAGTPVISSDAASMPEVLRKQALYFKNDSEEELKRILLELDTILPSLPRKPDEFQMGNYRFAEAAAGVIELVK